MEEFKEFRKAMQETAYKYVEEGERHGSHELTWSRQDGGFTRFVVLAATPEAVTPQYTQHSVEVWVGADDGESFARSLLASFERIDLNDLKKEPLLSTVKGALQCAVIRADSMTKDELTNRHVTTARIRETSSLWEPREQAR